MSDENKEYGFGKYSVTEIAHTLIPMRDGVNLAVRLWIPDLLNPSFSPQFAQYNTNKHAKLTIKSEHGGPNKDETFGSILEYLPYYKDGFTSTRDHARHPWFASHGFVVVRAEIRGTGASEGMYYGEYLPQEFKDCVDILNHIAEQPWSNGNVGMYGKSWGGFNGLQMGYLQPAHLKTAVSLYSTDNRYTDDVHYQGGTVVGNGMLSWAAAMFCWDSRPPPPKYFKCREEWLRAWRERLDKAGQSCLVSWLEHQHADDKYWKHGSIDQDWGKVKMPVLAIGGLEDGYTNAAYRMAQNLSDESKVIIGPWIHDWPDISVAGPRIDYLNVCLSWFSHHLKEKDSSPKSPATWPKLQVFVRDSFKTKDLYTKEDMGTFIKFPKCPENKSSLKEYSSNFDTPECNEGVFFFSKDNLLACSPKAKNLKDAIKLDDHALQGHGCGAWLSFGAEFAWAGDQSKSITHSVNFTSEPLKDTLVMVGDSTLFAALSSQTFDRSYIHAKVCDIFEDGTSTLVTRCQVNLCTLEYTSLPDQDVRVYALKMNFAAHNFAAGHRVSISLSPTYFPLMWPSSSKDEVHFHPGVSYFTYQTVAADYLNTHRVHYPPPKPLLQIQKEVLSGGKAEGEYISEGGVYGVIYRDDSGKVHLFKENYTTQEVTTEKYTTDKTVTHGKAVVTKVLTMTFDGVKHDDDAGSDIGVRIETTQSMEGGYETFITAEKVRLFLDNQLFWEKSWANAVPRLDDLTV